MHEIAAEIVAWALHTVAAAAGTSVLLLARWIHRVDKAFEAHRLCVSEHYVRREDYVHQISLVHSRFDGQSALLRDQAALLSRIDERTRSQADLLARIDERTRREGA